MKRKTPVASQNVSKAREHLSPAACRSCRAMVGLAVDSGLGLAFTVDIAPLSRTDVAACVVAGRWVFEVRGYLSRRWIKHLSAARLAAMSFTSTYPLVAEHRCKGATT